MTARLLLTTAKSHLVTTRQVWLTSENKCDMLTPQDCKDQCQQKSCYYYHCDNYKTCWDACQSDKECQGHCSYKGCDYGLYDTLQELIDAVSAAANLKKVPACQSHTHAGTAMLMLACTALHAAPNSAPGSTLPEQGVDATVCQICCIISCSFSYLNPYCIKSSSFLAGTSCVRHEPVDSP